MEAARNPVHGLSKYVQCYGSDGAVGRVELDSFAQVHHEHPRQEGASSWDFLERFRRCSHHSCSSISRLNLVSRLNRPQQGKIDLADPSTEDEMRLEFDGVHFLSNGSFYSVAESIGYVIPDFVIFHFSNKHLYQAIC